MDNNNAPNQPEAPKEPASAPILDVQPPSQSSEPVVPSTPEIATQPDNQLADEPAVTETGAPDPVKRPEITAKHKHGAPVVPIIIALVIAAALAVVTVLAFKSAEKAAAPTTDGTNLTQQESEVTPQSVDDTSAEIDQALNSVDEAADFPESELSDQTLGL